MSLMITRETSPTAASQPIRLLIHGASGRMGAVLLRLLRDRNDIALAAAYARSAARADAGIDIAASTQLPDAPAFDIAIDFSLPDAFDAILALCRSRGVALVSGTTGLDDAQRARLQAAAADIPVLWSANFSFGVAVLADLVQRAAATLHDWDCDIVEAHHVHKKDAPSGTALRLGEAVAAAGGAARYASLRAGDIVGEHLVQFAGPGERVELIHRATDRDVFARGALRAATWLARQPSGAYAMRDLLASLTGA